MEPQIRQLVDVSDTAAARLGQVEITLECARWASHVFTRFDRERVWKIVDAVADCIQANAGRLAELTVAEGGFGVVEHKRIKNELTGRALADHYRECDFINPRIIPKRKIVEIPKPAGVVLALIPSTNPVATINFKILSCLMTRNAVVISPHPAVLNSCIEAVNTLAAAAERAGAPVGCIQVIETPSLSLIEAYMRSPQTQLILATGGSAMVRAAYASSNPAIGVGPGNAPVYVHPSADFGLAAQRIIDSKSFDNSVLCTSESVLISHHDCQSQLHGAFKKAGGFVCDAEQSRWVREFLFDADGFRTESLGRDAAWIAAQCGISIPASCKVLLAPIEHCGVEEPLASEKLCPVLAWYPVATVREALSSARALLRLSGAGHSAAIHCRDERIVLMFGQALECYRIVINAPSSQGAAGFETHLAPSFTIGTGYYGRSTIADNLSPDHLLHWTRLAYNADPDEAFGNFSRIALQLDGPLPIAPADGVSGQSGSERDEFSSAPTCDQRPSSTGDHEALDPSLRAELRRLISEELRAMLDKKAR